MNDLQVVSVSLIAALSTGLGGLLPVVKRRVSEAYLSLLMAFSAGIVLATAFHELIPEALDKADAGALAIGGGFLLMYVFERLMIVHACPESSMECEVHHLSWSAFLGLSVHSLIDGIAIAAGFEVSTGTGLVITLAVLIHEFPEGFATSSILLADGYSRAKAYLGSLFVGLMTPVGAVLGTFILGASTELLGLGLGISAGTFIYIATSDLLPEAHHRYRSYWLIPAIIGGYLLVVTSEQILH